MRVAPGSKRAVEPERKTKEARLAREPNQACSQHSQLPTEDASFGERRVLRLRFAAREPRLRRLSSLFSAWASISKLLGLLTSNERR